MQRRQFLGLILDKVLGRWEINAKCLNFTDEYLPGVEERASRRWGSGVAQSLSYRLADGDRAALAKCGVSARTPDLAEQEEEDEVQTI